MPPKTIESPAGSPSATAPPLSRRERVVTWLGTARHAVGAMPPGMALSAAFALFVLVGLTFAALFVDRPITGEEPPLFNPSYEFAHTGNLAFPDYAYAMFYGPRLFSQLAIHPPTHYLLVGLALRLGDGIRLAEGLPVLVMIAIALLLVVKSRLSIATQLASAFALFAASSFAIVYFSDSSFGARPELHVAVTWFAGLFALEGGRRRDWNAAWLFLGAALLTLAATMQWFASVAWVGAAAYAVAAFVGVGPSRSRRPIVALVAGVLVVGIPYLAFFIIPEWTIISEVRRSGWSGGLWGIWHFNLTEYGWLRESLSSSLDGPTRWTSGLFQLGLLTRIPPFIIATALLLARRETRLMALASLPPFLFYFFLTPLHGYYVIIEVLYFTFAAVAGLIAAVQWGARALAGAVDWGARALRGAAVPAVATVCIAVFLGWAAWTGTPALSNVTFKYGPLPTPLEVDRAAAQQIVGTNALVTSQHQLWYMAGGRYWHDFTPDLINVCTTLYVRCTSQSSNPADYFRRFQYVADIPILFFDPTQLHAAPRQTVAFAEYASKDLHLRGVVADSWSYGFSLFSARPGAIHAFARTASSMYRFDQAPGAGYTFTSFICPYGSATAIEVLDDPNGYPEAFLPIADAFVKLPPPAPLTQPLPSSNAPLQSIEAVIVPREDYATESAKYAAAGCQVRDHVTGTFGRTDPYRLAENAAPGADQVTIYATADEAVRAARSR